MLRLLLSLLVALACHLVAPSAEACSPAIDEVTNDLGFDAENSPNPTILEIYVEEFDGGGACGTTSCDGQRSVRGEVSSDVEITHVGVGQDGGFVNFGYVTKSEEGIYAFSIPGDDATQLRFYNASGYHSAPEDVAVSEQGGGGCALDRRSQPPITFGLLLLAAVLGLRRRRERA